MFGADFRDYFNDTESDYGDTLNSKILGLTIEEIQEIAKEKAWVPKATIFSNLADGLGKVGEREIDKYNELLGTPSKYRILSEDAKWVEEKERGQVTTRYCIFVKYVEYNEAIYKENFDKLMVEFNKREGVKEEEKEYSASFGELSSPGKQKMVSIPEVEDIVLEVPEVKVKKKKKAAVKKTEFKQELEDKYIKSMETTDEDIEL